MKTPIFSSKISNQYQFISKINFQQDRDIFCFPFYYYIHQEYTRSVHCLQMLMLSLSASHISVQCKTRTDLHLMQKIGPFFLTTTKKGIIFLDNSHAIQLIFFFFNQCLTHCGNSIPSSASCCSYGEQAEEKCFSHDVVRQF